jgi:hypothetical protein
MHVVDRFQCRVRFFNGLYGLTSEVKIGGQIVDCAAGCFLAVELRDGLPMAFWVQGLKALRADHPDDMLVGKPRNLSIAGKLWRTRRTAGTGRVPVRRLVARW